MSTLTTSLKPPALCDLHASPALPPALPLRAPPPAIVLDDDDLSDLSQDSTYEICYYEEYELTPMLPNGTPIPNAQEHILTVTQFMQSELNDDESWDISSLLNIPNGFSDGEDDFGVFSNVWVDGIVSRRNFEISSDVSSDSSVCDDSDVIFSVIGTIRPLLEGHSSFCVQNNEKVDFNGENICSHLSPKVELDFQVETDRDERILVVNSMTLAPLGYLPETQSRILTPLLLSGLVRLSAKLIPDDFQRIVSKIPLIRVSIECDMDIIMESASSMSRSLRMAFSQLYDLLVEENYSVTKIFMLFEEYVSRMAGTPQATVQEDPISVEILKVEAEMNSEQSPTASEDENTKNSTKTPKKSVKKKKTRKRKVVKSEELSDSETVGPTSSGTIALSGLSLDKKSAASNVKTPKKRSKPANSKAKTVKASTPMKKEKSAESVLSSLAFRQRINKKKEKSKANAKIANILQARSRKRALDMISTCTSDQLGDFVNEMREAAKSCFNESQQVFDKLREGMFPLEKAHALFSEILDDLSSDIFSGENPVGAIGRLVGLTQSVYVEYSISDRVVWNSSWSVLHGIRCVWKHICSTETKYMSDVLRVKVVATVQTCIGSTLFKDLRNGPEM